MLNFNIYSQMEIDSVNSFNNFNYTKTDLSIINFQIFFYPLNLLQTEQFNNKSLYSLYTDSQINSGFNIELQSNVLLNQFKIAQNWETKKKYGVFAKYLGIAQFMGVVGLAAVHFSKFNPPPKGKTSFNYDKIRKP